MIFFLLGTPLKPKYLKHISTAPALNVDYFCINHGGQRVFFNSNHHKCLSYLFLLHLNTYVTAIINILFLEC